MHTTQRMKTALQRAIQLLRRHAVLWRPVILATALSYGVTLLRSRLIHWLLLTMMTRRSVLDGSRVFDDSLLGSRREYVYALPLWLVGEFLIIVIFAYALLITARKVLAITAEAPDRQSVFGAILWFSAKVMFAYHLFTLLITVPMHFIPLRFLHTSGYILGIVSQLLLTLVAAAMSIRFLARVLHRHATPSAIRSARGLAILCVTLSIAIAFLVPRIQHPLFAFWPHMTQPAVQTVFLAGEVLSTLPCAPLFVALALLLTEESVVESSSLAPEPASEPSPSTP